MGHRRRLRRQNERLREQIAPESVSDMGSVEEPGAVPPGPGWLAQASALGATAIGAAAGFAVGGPIGAVVLGGIGAAVDWARK